MDFAYSEEQRALQRTARDFLAAQGGLTRARKILDGDAAWDRELWSGISQLGWLGAALPEEFGGGGRGYLDVAVLAEELGRTLAAVPSFAALHAVCEAIRRHGSPQLRERVLPKIASGELVPSLTYVGEGLDTLRVRGATVSGSHPSGPGGAVAEWSLLVLASSDATGLCWVDLRQPNVSREEKTASLDATRLCGALRFEDATVEPLSAGCADVRRLVNGAAVLLAFEQLGAATRAFEVTQEHIEHRFAFGRPIASFQAIKHRFVDLFVALELARSHCLFAGWALESNSAELPTAAAGAHIAASRALELAAREMIQLHSGVGFTWEYDCHLFYRRSKADAITLGAPREWCQRLVHALH